MIRGYYFSREILSGMAWVKEYWLIMLEKSSSPGISKKIQEWMMCSKTDLFHTVFKVEM